MALFFAFAVGGLFYVKWSPYYAKAFFAAQHHTLGASILSGTKAAPPTVGWQAGLAYSIAYLKAIWQALLLGLALGAGVEALLPRAILGRLFTGSAASLRATAFAVPSMMCTCCTAPITVGLLESGASPTSALVYWLANPALNPAVLVVIGIVLGWQWAALRLVMGLALVFVVGYAATRLVPPGWRVTHAPRPPSGTNEHFLLAWVRAFIRLAVRLVPEYAVLVFALGVLRAWLFPEMTPAIGHAFWLGPALAAAGTLLVIPTAGEVPIIQILQHFGLGGAGAAALLITLPAVSLPSLAMLGRALPLRAIVSLGFGTFVFGLLAAAAAATLGLP
ncbi:MAG: permease [Alphaproteobacteria bacterium]|nr:permease [Alphaproteobacteria bacterium]